MDAWFLLFAALLLTGIKGAKRSVREAIIDRQTSETMIGFLVLVVLAGLWQRELSANETNTGMFAAIFQSSGSILTVPMLFMGGYQAALSLKKDTACKAMLQKTVLRYGIVLLLAFLLQIVCTYTLPLKSILAALVGWPGVLMDEYRVGFAVLLLSVGGWAAGKLLKMVGYNEKHPFSGALIMISIVMAAAAWILRKTGDGLFCSMTLLSVPCGFVMASFETTVSKQEENIPMSITAAVAFTAIFQMIVCQGQTTMMADIGKMLSLLILFVLVNAVLTIRQPVLQLIGRHWFTTLLFMQLPVRLIKFQMIFKAQPTLTWIAMLGAVEFVAFMLDALVDNLVNGKGVRADD